MDNLEFCKWLLHWTINWTVFAAIVSALGQILQAMKHLSVVVLIALIVSTTSAHAWFLSGGTFTGSTYEGGSGASSSSTSLPAGVTVGIGGSIYRIFML